jgi:NADPH:quinone reductase-like Zn-dependent oxidoreductase
MQAIQIHAFGDAGVLELRSIEKPLARDTDVLVRVIASGINPIEWKIREGHMARALGRPLPVVLGYECAGIVETVGAKVGRFKASDTVWAYSEFTRDGTHAEFVAIDESQVALMPNSLTFTQAAGAALTSQAAWAAVAAANVASGERVLIHGAGGAVGHFLVQFAKSKGALVAANVGHEARDALRANGADEIIDYTRQRFEDVGRFDVVFDLVGGDTQRRSWTVLERGGRLVSTASPPSEAMAKEAGAKGIFIFTPPDGAVLQRIAAMLDEGSLRPLPVAAVLPLAQAAEAHRRGQSGSGGAKMVLQVATA